MCFDHDSRPPIRPIEGGALDGRALELESGDGTRFDAFLARAAEPTGTGIVILPDVRGLHRYYRDLALRFAEHGVDALAFDYFGRTTEPGERPADFEHAPHVALTSFANLRADTTAAVDHLRSTTGVERMFSVGFCFGGRLAFLSAGFGLGLAGVIGFYGVPVGPPRQGMPAPADMASTFEAPVLGLFGGTDQSITPEARAAFEAALTAAGVEHRIVTYDGAPHSFFDRKHDEFAEASAAAWDEVLAFTGARGQG